MLSSREYRSVLAVLRTCEEAESTDQFRNVALRAIQEHLGYERLTFYLGMHPSVRLALRDPVSVGVPKPLIDTYLSHFAVLDPFGADHGRGLFCVAGMACLPQVLDGALTPAHEEYLADFLDPSGITDKVMLWLDTELPVHGFLGVIATGERAFDKRDREMLDLLRPHLTYMLRAHLRRSPQPDTGSLTSREQEVARLVADGCSNRAIARQLNICEGTVKKHITRVLTKSDVRSRTELAVRWRSGV